jgi:hypothetical protein
MSRPTVRRLAAAAARSLVARGRAMMLVPAPDDQLLADYRFVADAAPRPRLNLVIPDLAAGEAFGGVMTGLDLFFALSAELSRRISIDLRVILTGASSDRPSPLLAQFASRHGQPAADVAVLPLHGPHADAHLRACDMFLTFNWSATLNMGRLAAAQAVHFDRSRMPIIYLIQEYEPHLLPFSSAQMLARDAYSVERLWGIFNGASLHRYFARMGHRVERAMVFEPSINHRLRPFLADVRRAKRARQILVYGRPGIDRNCFPALVRGLRLWAERHPEFADWTVVSAGTKHRAVPLGDGRAMTSLGKLELEDYARLLLASSAGISLMASPHPSYPPLEMAHFGVRTVTNRYPDKAWTGAHPNILAVDSIDASSVSAALAEACRRSLVQPPAVDSASGFLRAEPYDGLGELAQKLYEEIRARS